MEATSTFFKKRDFTVTQDDNNSPSCQTKNVTTLARAFYLQDRRFKLICEDLRASTFPATTKGASEWGCPRKKDTEIAKDSGWERAYVTGSDDRLGDRWMRSKQRLGALPCTPPTPSALHPSYFWCRHSRRRKGPGENKRGGKSETAAGKSHMI